VSRPRTEKGWISEELAREERQKLGHGSDSIFHGLASGRVWHLVFVYLGMVFGLHILSSWAPQLVKALSASYSNRVIGLLLIMPNAIGLVAMILCRSNGQTGSYSESVGSMWGVPTSQTTCLCSRETGNLGTGT
jgi:hypothetical protein